MPKEYVYSLGGDPEVFIKSTKTGKVIPSCDLIGGTKGKGISIGPNKDGIRILEDNVAVEFNFKPANDYLTFYNRIQNVVAYGESYVRERAQSILYPTSWHEFTDEELLPDKAQIFGCDPDFCAYETDGKEARKMNAFKMGRNRFCGGHLHLGYENPEKVPHYAVAQLLDMALGLPSVKYDKQGARRHYYGLPGLFRPKDYGIEYRTMSNWWMRPESADNVQRMSYECFYLMQYITSSVLELGHVYDKMPLQDVRAAIAGESVSDCKILHTQFRRYCAEHGLSLGSSFRIL